MEAVAFDSRSKQSSPRTMHLQKSHSSLWFREYRLNFSNSWCHYYAVSEGGFLPALIISPIPRTLNPFSFLTEHSWLGLNIYQDYTFKLKNDKRRAESREWQKVAGTLGSSHSKTQSSFWGGPDPALPLLSYNFPIPHPSGMSLQMMPPLMPTPRSIGQKSIPSMLMLSCASKELTCIARKHPSQWNTCSHVFPSFPPSFHYHYISFLFDVKSF